MTQIEVLTRHLADCSKGNNERGQSEKAVSGPRLRNWTSKIKNWNAKLSIAMIEITN
jgi:hypothetical protein